MKAFWNHEQVLVSAAAACTLAQILKPLAAALSGHGFNWKLVIKSGGMPSSHSAVSTSICNILSIKSA
jgi:acid phosphatase family membrane protein YuiD